MGTPSSSDPVRTRTLALLLAELFVHLKEPREKTKEREEVETVVIGLEKEHKDDEDDEDKKENRVSSMADSVVQLLTTLCNEQNRADGQNLKTVADALKVLKKK